MSENPDRLRLCGLSGLFGTTEHTGKKYFVKKSVQEPEWTTGRIPGYNSVQVKNRMAVDRE